jgi:hypothetical protein
MKTLHNLNNAMHAHDSLFVHYEPHALFVIMSLTLSSLLWASRSLLYYEPHTLFVIMSLTLSSLLWASRSLHYYEPHALFFIMSLKLSSLLWASRSLLYYGPHALCFTIQTLYSYSLQIMLSSNTMNQSTWNFIILLCIIKSQLQHPFKYFNQFKTFHLCIIS